MRHIDPDKMTAEERLERIVEILVKAGLRLFWEAPLRSLRELRGMKEKRGGEESTASNPPKKPFAGEGPSGTGF